MPLTLNMIMPKDSTLKEYIKFPHIFSDDYIIRYQGLQVLKAEAKEFLDKTMECRIDDATVEDFDWFIKVNDAIIAFQNRKIYGKIKTAEDINKIDLGDDEPDNETEEPDEVNQFKELDVPFHCLFGIKAIAHGRFLGYHHCNRRNGDRHGPQNRELLIQNDKLGEWKDDHWDNRIFVNFKIRELLPYDIPEFLEYQDKSPILDKRNMKPIKNEAKAAWVSFKYDPFIDGIEPGTKEHVEKIKYLRLHDTICFGEDKYAMDPEKGEPLLDSDKEPIYDTNNKFIINYRHSTVSQRLCLGNYFRELSDPRKEDYGMFGRQLREYICDNSIYKDGVTDEAEVLYTFLGPMYQNWAAKAKAIQEQEKNSNIKYLKDRILEIKSYFPNDPEIQKRADIFISAL